MKPYIQNLLIIALLIMVLFLAFHCSTKPTPTEQIKTVYVKGKETVRVDTVKVKLSVNNPKPIVTRSVDTMYLHDTIWCDSIREYELKNDTVQINTTVQGRLIKQTVLYTMYNTSTKRVDTVFVTERSKFRPVFAVGATLQFDSIGYIKPALGMLYVRKKASYSGSVNSNGRVTIGGYFNLIK